MKQVLKTGAELRSFLERIVETSVQSAQDVVAEEERQRQLELYKKMQEQEEEEEVEEEPADEKPKAAAKPEEDAEKIPCKDLLLPIVHLKSPRRQTMST